MIAPKIKDITVVVVTYNSSRVILDALAPFAHQQDIHLLVIDNNSSDSTVRDVGRVHPNATVVENRSNVGFAKAVNMAIERCSSPYVLLLNPDAVIAADDVRTLRAAMLPGTGLIAPLIKDPGERLTIISAGHFPTIWRMFAHYSGAARLSRSNSLLQGHYLFKGNLRGSPMPVDWVTGACMLFEKDTWRKAGGLSEKWFMYAEDIDFCFRVRNLGLDVVLHPVISASHLVGQSDLTESFRANPAWVLNLHDFYESELSPSSLHGKLWCGVVSVGLLSRSILFGMKALNDGGASPWAVEAKRFKVFAIAVTARLWMSGGKSRKGHAEQKLRA